MLKANDACYLCHNSDFTFRKGSVRDNPELKIMECPNCGLVMLNSFDHIREMHYEDSGMHGSVGISMDHWLRETERDDQRRFDMLRDAMTNRKILDFGCGASGFLRKASFAAAEAIGVEPERRVREYWKGELQLHGSLDDVGGDFDLITMFHVLEHLADPRAMLLKLAGLLKPAGRMVIEVPSSEDALLTIFDNVPFQNFTYWSQHLFLFNMETMRQLATQAGLKVVAIQQFQRYPLSNHLYWLTNGQPGGHQRWSFLDNPALEEAYAASLASIGKCDTLIAFLERKSD